MRLRSIEDLVGLLGGGAGRRQAGEPVSELEHALQTAELAERSGARAEMVAAALLHDVGRLVDDVEAGAPGRGLADRHQETALPLLAPLFGPPILEPIRLHVAAKRYLCATVGGYARGLSEGARARLAFQGGPYTFSEATAFIRQPFAPEAVILRRWDDYAKTPRWRTPPLDHYADFLRSCALVAAR
jgi:predicted HD phosphohydrolase